MKTIHSQPKLKIRKQLARSFARNFAAGILENAEVAVQPCDGLNDAEIQEAQLEMNRLAARIMATIKTERP